MGYRTGAVCYATQAEAQDAFYTSQPVDTSTVTTNGQALRFYKDSQGAWHLQKLTINQGSYTVANDVSWPGYTFPTCTYEQTVFDPVLAGALWMFALTMVLGCWLLAKNAGIIINMVKWW